MSSEDSSRPPADPRILVTGANGMLGHKVFQVLSAKFPETWATLRADKTDSRWRANDLLQGSHIIDQMDWTQPSAFARLRELQPDVVVNCAGIIKQRVGASPRLSIAINSLLPHMLVSELRKWGGRLIHISSDCVFTGQKGQYVEGDFSDADDVYGRTKYLGEVGAEGAITLRTSIIGRELQFHHSLLDWFLAQQGPRIRGYTRAWWSGVTNLHLAEIIAWVIVSYPSLSGVYQVSSGRISKYELLTMLRDAYGRNLDIEADDVVFCDRSLDGQRFSTATGYAPPTWPAMISALVNDPTPYDRWLA